MATTAAAESTTDAPSRGDDGQARYFYASCEDPTIGEAYDCDGFVCLSGVIDPPVLRVWRAFADSHFEKTFKDLHSHGHISSPKHSRVIEDGSIQYSLQSGVKYGYREIVMRSPGRYELSLLYDISHPPLEPLLDILQPLLPSVLNESTWKDVQICHVSLLVSTPGAPEQSWHSDGGHVDLSRHLPCHCANIFLPLVSVPIELGPTELRPGTHHHTRDLARMMLLAKARKTLRPPILPILQCGDALVFDYRILHRGLANESSTTSRPILVLTVAKRWFMDVCNFPKRSLYDDTVGAGGTTSDTTA